MTETSNSVFNTDRLTSLAIVGVPLAATAYGIFKIENMPNALPHESTYASVAVVGGILLSVSQVGRNGIDRSELVANAGNAALISGATYSIARGIFKSSPKTAFIATGVVLASAIVYNYRNNISNLFKGKSATAPSESLQSAIKKDLDNLDVQSKITEAFVKQNAVQPYDGAKFNFEGVNYTFKGVQCIVAPCTGGTWV